MGWPEIAALARVMTPTGTPKTTRTDGLTRGRALLRRGRRHDPEPTQQPAERSACREKGASFLGGSPRQAFIAGLTLVSLLTAQQAAIPARAAFAAKAPAAGPKLVVAFDGTGFWSLKVPHGPQYPASTDSAGVTWHMVYSLSLPQVYPDDLRAQTPQSWARGIGGSTYTDTAPRTGKPIDCQGRPIAPRPVASQGDPRLTSLDKQLPGLPDHPVGSFQVQAMGGDAYQLCDPYIPSAGWAGIVQSTRLFMVAKLTLDLRDWVGTPPRTTIIKLSPVSVRQTQGNEVWSMQWKGTFTISSTPGCTPPVSMPPLPQPPDPSSPTIVWRTSPQLNWSDYQGQIPQSSPFKAETSSLLPYYKIRQDAYTIQYSPAARTCSTTVTYWVFDGNAEFNPKTSWVQPQAIADPANSAYLLNHEQKHFDIAEAYGKSLRSRLLADLGNTLTHTFTGPSVADVNSQVQALFARLFNESLVAYAKLGAEQVAYDNATQHGSDRPQQQRWNQIIAGWLQNPMTAPY